MKRIIAWVGVLLLLIGMLGGCKRSEEGTAQIAGAASGVVQQNEGAQKDEAMIPPADQPEAEEPPVAGESVEEKNEVEKDPPTEETEKTEPPPESTEPEETEPEEEIDLNAGNRFSPRKPMEPGYDKYYCDATIEDEFEPGVLTVRLIHDVSYPNKKWPLSTFACVDPVSAVHTNYYDDPEVIARLKLDIYTQSFKITLKEKTKEAVLKAIRELEKLDIVYFAEPLYTQGNESCASSLIDSSVVLNQSVGTVNRSANTTDSGYRPNDSYTEYQYALDQIKLPAAWNSSIGTNSLIDTGIIGKYKSNAS